MGAREQTSQAKMQQLQADNQAMKAEMQQLQNEMVAKDQRIQDLEQRDYIERCQSGVFETPFDAFTSKSRDRHIELKTTFSRAFRTTPVVTVGLATLDHLNDGDVNIRVASSVVYVSTTSLTVRIGTWNYSKLYSAKVYWMACA
uniref:H-type lectin domain-containing protein n=1 Tax=Branchiostoma floridae TaxID=7739 RepID=C3XSX0_BRAFL|eukprot:XP_002612829.1 hypothetical protein BRAFLDRAFT_67223 [Branchiostoma floridae]